jgi:hypothetical protein
MEVYNGKNTQFWEDVCVREIPLKLSFPQIYEYCRDKKCLVSEPYKEGGWYMDLKRPLIPIEELQWGS